MRRSVWLSGNSSLTLSQVSTVVAVTCSGVGCVGSCVQEGARWVSPVLLVASKGNSLPTLGLAEGRLALVCRYTPFG